MTNGLKLIILVLSTVFLLSCKTTSPVSTMATSQLPKPIVVMFIPKEVNVPIPDYLKDIKARYRNKWDNTAQNFALNEAKKYNLLNENAIEKRIGESCEAKISMAKQTFLNRIKNTRLFKYESFRNHINGQAIIVDENIEITPSVQSMQFPTETQADYTYNVSPVFDWSDHAEPGIGKGSISMNTFWSCEKDNVVKVAVNLRSIEISNPIIDFGFTEEIGKVMFSQSQFSSLNNIEITYVDKNPVYDKLVRNVAGRLAYRFSIEAKSSKYSETKLDVSNDVLVARIQRSLTSLSFNSKITNFIHVSNLEVKGVPTKVTTTFKIYPESGNTSYILVETSFNSVTDRFHDREIFAEEDAFKISKEIYNTFVSVGKSAD